MLFHFRFLISYFYSKLFLSTACSQWAGMVVDSSTEDSSKSIESETPQDIQVIIIFDFQSFYIIFLFSKNSRRFFYNSYYLCYFLYFIFAYNVYRFFFSFYCVFRYFLFILVLSVSFYYFLFSLFL